MDCFVRACLNSTSSTSKAPRVHQEPCFLSACLVHLPVHSHPPLVDSVSCLFACPDRPNLTLPLLAILQDFLFVSTSTLLEGSRIQTSRDSLLAMHAVGASLPGHNQMLGQIPNKNIDPWRWACRQMLRSGQKHTHTLEIRWSGKATLHYSVVVHRRRRRWRGVQTVAGDWHCLLLLRQPGPASH